MKRFFNYAVFVSVLSAVGAILKGLQKASQEGFGSATTEFIYALFASAFAVRFLIPLARGQF